MFERPDFTDPRFEEHAWYFHSYQDAILPFCRGAVLDIGAGHGYLSRAIAERNDVVSVLATDRHYDPDRAQRHEKLRFCRVSTEELVCDFPLHRFDTIVATEHIEHLPESLHVELLQFVSVHLDKQGCFVGSMPQVKNSGNPFHLREYLAEEWKAVLLKFFPKVEIWFPNPLLYVWKASGL